MLLLLETADLRHVRSASTHQHAARQGISTGHCAKTNSKPKTNSKAASPLQAPQGFDVPLLSCSPSCIIAYMAAYKATTGCQGGLYTPFRATSHVGLNSRDTYATRSRDRCGGL